MQSPWAETRFFFFWEENSFPRSEAISVVLFSGQVSGADTFHALKATESTNSCHLEWLSEDQADNLGSVLTDSELAPEENSKDVFLVHFRLPRQRRKTRAHCQWSLSGTINLSTLYNEHVLLL